MTQRSATSSRTPARSNGLGVDVVRAEAGWRRRGRHSPAVMARQVAGAVAAALELPHHPLSFTLVLSSDAAVRLLNRKWRGKDKPTNVLSFPLASGGSLPPGASGHLGDVVVAQETLEREATDLGLSFDDHFRHLVLHGLLHLLGYDHERDEDADEMEALETRILKTMGIADPYAAPAATSTRRRRAARPEPGRR
jgi:probable rRNA maturation factor